MIVVNFSQHPLTVSQKEQIEQESGESITSVVDSPQHYDPNQPFPTQAIAQVKKVISYLKEAKERKEKMGIILPGLNVAAVLVLLEVVKQLGEFPYCIRLKPTDDPRIFAVAEIIDLNSVLKQRERAVKCLLTASN